MQPDADSGSEVKLFPFKPLDADATRAAYGDKLRRKVAALQRAVDRPHIERCNTPACIKYVDELEKQIEAIEKQLIDHWKLSADVVELAAIKCEPLLNREPPECKTQGAPGERCVRVYSKSEMGAEVVDDLEATVCAPHRAALNKAKRVAETTDAEPQTPAEALAAVKHATEQRRKQRRIFL
jgi:hypothetical protein